MVPLRLLYSLAMCAAGQLPFPVLGFDQSEAATSTPPEREPEASEGQADTAHRRLPA